MTVLPMLNYQMNQVLPSGKPIFIRKLISHSPLFEQFKASCIFEIYCNSDFACGYIIQKAFSNSTSTFLINRNLPFYLIDTNGNPIVHFTIQRSLLSDFVQVLANNGQNMGSIYKNFDLFNHTYSLYNAYESKIGFIKSPRFFKKQFDLYSLAKTKIGSINRAINSNWSALIDLTTTFQVQLSSENEFNQSEKILLIANSILIELNHHS